MQTSRVSFTGRHAIIATGLALAYALTGAPLRAQSAGQAPGPATNRPALRLSMQQAVDMALETNLGLKADRLGPQLAAEDLASVRALFNPSLSSGFQRNTSDSVSTSFAQSTASTITSNSTGVSASLNQQLPWYGGSYSVGWSGQRSETTAFSSFNPTLSSRVSAVFSQPLLRGFKVDSNRQAIKTATRAMEIADVNLRQSVLTTDHNVRTAYLGLIGALARRDVAQQNLDISRKSFENIQAQVKVGTMAPTNVYDADADVASNEQQLIASEAAITTAQDTLRALIVDPARPDYWSVDIDPTDEMQVQPQQIDVEAAVKNALANRLDLVTARKQLEINDLNIAVLRDATLTSVNFQLQYSANGVAGTQLQYGSGFPPAILSQSSRGYGGALSDTFTNTNPSWTYGVQVGYPIGRSSQEAQLARARLDRQQQETLLRSSELQVATAVHAAARQVDTLFKQVQALQKSREAQDHRLDAENKKFAVGLSTTFNLSTVQRDLAAAKVNELQAKIAYNQALIDFEAVQRIR